MAFTFDPAKKQSNIAKHGVSPRRAEECDFGSVFYDRDDSQDYGEVRDNAIGWLGGVLHTLTFSQKALQSAPSASAKRPKRSRKYMPRIPKPSPRTDADNHEWTVEKFARAKRLDQLPEGLRQALVQGKRGPQKAPTKTLISLRLSSDVLKALRASGKGWQTMVDDALRRQFLK